MKKEFMILGIALMFLGTVCFADTGPGVSRTEYSVNIRNNTGEPLDFLIPTTTIRPKIDKITGYDCSTLAPSGANTETWVSMFDSTDSLMTGEVLGEQEGTGGQESIGDRWPRGKKIVNGVSTRQGAFTDLIIYFIKE